MTDSLQAILTNSIDFMLVLLACGALGEIFSSTSLEMGDAGIMDCYS
jgi:hypothetical protein